MSQEKELIFRTRGPRGRSADQDRPPARDGGQHRSNTRPRPISRRTWLAHASSPSGRRPIGPGPTAAVWPQGSRSTAASHQGGRHRHHDIARDRAYGATVAAEGGRADGAGRAGRLSGGEERGDATSPDLIDLNRYKCSCSRAMWLPDVRVSTGAGRAGPAPSINDDIARLFRRYQVAAANPVRQPFRDAGETTADQGVSPARHHRKDVIASAGR